LIFPDFAQNSTAPSLPRQVPELFNVRGEAIARPEFFQLRTQRSVGRLGSHGKTMGKPWENHGKTYGKPMDMSRKNIHEIPYDVLVGGLEHVFFSIQLGMSSSQLTKSIIFQRGRYTTNQIFMNRRSTILHGFLIVSQLLWIQIQ
jgi:hypothetical protein